MNRHHSLQQRLTRCVSNTIILQLLARLTGRVTWLKQLTAIREVTGSDLSRNADCPDVFRGFLQSLQTSQGERKPI
jgi:hypothetical protein